jgi:predicted transcriptional regulator of viral defense system
MTDLIKYVDGSGILLTKEVLNDGHSKDALYKFIMNNGLKQVGHGIYAEPDLWEDDQYILSLRCPQAVFSHDEALYYHRLIDREPLQQTVTIYTGYGTARLVKDGIKVFTVKRELLETGKITIINSFGHNIPIYDLERTVCDLVRSRSRFEIQDFQTALKTYISRKDKDLSKLMEYAKSFHVDSIIRGYMEVML